MALAAIALIILLAVSGLVRGRLRLHGGRDTAYAAAAAKQVAGYGLPAIAALFLIGRGEALVAMPPEFFVAGWGGGDVADLLPGLAGGVAAGSAIGALLARRRWRRTGRRGPVLGEIGWIEPRNRRELGWTTLLSLLAGVCEELFFRLALPLLATLATGNLVIGQLLTLAAFGSAHRYQGAAGVAATTMLGALFAALYLASGSFWLAVVAHVLIDLNSLVIRPAVTGAWRK